MKHPFALRAMIVMVLTTTCFSMLQAAEPPSDPGWPRVFTKDNIQLSVYQPQVDYWNGYTNLHCRCAIAVKGVAKQEKFGVAEIDAVTVTDHDARLVALLPVRRDIRFPNTSDSELASLRAAVDELKPPGHAMTLSLDRLLACLDPADQPVQRPVAVNLDPPKILYSRQPAILVMMLGGAQFKPVDANRTDLEFAVNANWDLFHDIASQRYFLLDQESWLAAPDVRGPWTAATSLPASLSKLPDNEDWADVRQNIPGKPAKTVPAVYVCTEPTELIVTDGDPARSAIKGTKLYRVTNTESVLFLHTGDSRYYLLVAGRWFRAATLDGPWSAASTSLPDDFVRIPDEDPSAFVKASVPGTRESKDAVLLASVPTTTTVSVTNTTVRVVYSGTPQFVTITNTVIQYAVNTPQQVLLVDGAYYCCDQGVWFVSGSATGPWKFCTFVPAVIYTIPPSSPMHNVTYVVVQGTTPTTVIYSQTSGYSGEYVAATGVLMFGAGMIAGAVIANNSHYYYPPYPCYYTYGCGVSYHYGYGGYYYKGGGVYGPYGGAGYSASYNPATGTYCRSSYAYGPYGSASRTVAYNPYTGARAASTTVSNPYGTTSRGAAYNPSTGNAAWGRSHSGADGSATGVRTSSGAAAASWDTANSQGKVVKTSSGDIYADRNGTVYKKDPNGTWAQNSGGGWQNTPTHTTATAPTTARTQTPPVETSSGWNQNRENLESQARARQYGEQQFRRTESFQSTYGGGGFRGGGGRRR